MADFASIRFQAQRPLLRELSADRLNTILTEITRNKPKGERGITVRQDGTGTYIGLAAALPRGSFTTTHPFQIASRQDPDNEAQYLVTVRPGTINSLLPSGIFDGAEIEKYTAAEDALKYIILEASSDGEQITAAAVSASNTTATVQTPVVFGLPSSAQFLLGIVYNATVYQVVTDNITVTGKQQYIASKATPAQPGELPYEIYYVWG
jgi:hypothetical protein